MNEKYFGKFRGKVRNTIDPLLLGRIQVSVPAVLGQGTLSWAMPCTPYAGPGVGFFAIPPIGANVWVEFEGGDLDYPIWVGCFWGVGEVPALPAIELIKVLKTSCIKMELSDVPGAGGFTLEVNPPAVAKPMKMVFNSAGIEIDNLPAKIKLTATDVQLTHTTAGIKIAPTAIEISNNPSKVKVTPADVEVSNGASKIKITAASVDVESTAKGKFSPAGIELKNGGQSVNLTAANVSINNGALEIM